MKEKEFKKSVTDLAVIKIEQREHQKRIGNFGKLAKMGVGMKPKEFKVAADVVYSSSPDALARVTKPKKTRLERLVDQLAETYAALSLIEKQDRLVEMLKNRGIAISEVFDGATTAGFGCQLSGKKLEKFNALWNKEFAVMAIPATAKERATALVNAGVDVRASVEDCKEKCCGDVLKATAEKVDVAKPHLSKAVNVKVLAINNGDGEAEQKVNEIIQNNTALANTLEVIAGDKN